MVKVTTTGSFDKTAKFIVESEKAVKLKQLAKYGEEGVRALSSVTPQRTGLTADSWYYTIENQNGKIVLNFCNSNIQNYVNIALILQTGHATKSGAWIEGIDYINPAIKPIFDKITREAWGEITRL